MTAISPNHTAPDPDRIKAFRDALAANTKGVVFNNAFVVAICDMALRAAEAEKDAARYRFLRKHAFFDGLVNEYEYDNELDEADVGTEEYERHADAVVDQSIQDEAAAPRAQHAQGPDYREGFDDDGDART